MILEQIQKVNDIKNLDEEQIEELIGEYLKEFKIKKTLEFN